MPGYTLYPSFVKIFYHSARGYHTMERPTLAWEGSPWASPGGYTAHDGTTEVDADTMINGLVNLIADLYTPSVVFDSYIIYTQSNDVGANPVPVWAAAFDDIAGGSGEANHLAYMKTFTFLTEDSHISKLVLLDVPTGGQITKSGSVTGAEALVAGALTASDLAWAGRDGKRCAVLRSLNNGVNKALEHKYGF